MNSTINIACLKWGSKYSAVDVNRLFRMVNKNLPNIGAFYCLTDDSTDLNPDIIALPLSEQNLTGWWYKLCFFQKDFYGLTGTLLFMDLDVVIVDDLSYLISYEPNKPFVTTLDWSHPQVNYNGFNSSIFRINLGSMPEVWHTFITNAHKAMSLLHGDQDWLDLMVTDYATYPKSWIVPFKSQTCNAKVPSYGVVGEWVRSKGLFKPKQISHVPDGAKIIIFNGLPNPSDVSDSAYLHWKHSPWIKEAWDE